MKTLPVVLGTALAAGALAVPAVAGEQRASATCSATPAQTEGPYYSAGPPKRQSILTTGTSGRRLILTGRVVGTDCRPLVGARVDFWQADGKGVYDNTGFRLRGWQRTDAKGRYRLVTVVPGLYPGRTEHIHVKVTPRGGSTLTTQLYFPGVAQNGQDGIYTAQTLVKLTTTTTPWRATFTFVVD